MTIDKVIERFESLFGEKCKNRNNRYVIRRVAWLLQATAKGGISEHPINLLALEILEALFNLALLAANRRSIESSSQ